MRRQPGATKNDGNTQKYVYSFGGGSAEGRAEMKDLLGGKGANLAEMSLIGIPGTTRLHDHHRGLRRSTTSKTAGFPTRSSRRSRPRLLRMEEAVGKKFGNAADPLLVSVRSGAALSMPGMMNTILNLGLTDASVEGLAKKTNNPRFAYDGYRRVIDMFGSTAMGVEHEEFEHELDSSKKERGVKLDTELDRRRPEGAGAALQGGLPEARRRAVSAGPERAALEVDHGGLQ